MVLGKVRPTGWVRSQALPFYLYLAAQRDMEIWLAPGGTVEPS